MSAVEILRQARELIADESRWTQNAFARNNAGLEVGSRARSAVCWCAYGAIHHIEADSLSIMEAKAILVQASMRMFGLPIAVVNDGITSELTDAHVCVIKAYDAAIADAEAANA